LRYTTSQAVALAQCHHACTGRGRSAHSRQIVRAKRNACHTCTAPPATELPLPLLVCRPEAEGPVCDACVNVCVSVRVFTCVCVCVCTCVRVSVYLKCAQATACSCVCVCVYVCVCVRE